jgi:hypothetical protein
MTPLASIFGHNSGTVEELDANDIRQRKVIAARSNSTWTELHEVDLVPRRRWLVHAVSDRMYSVFRGATFDAGGKLCFNETLPLAFIVTKDGDVVVLEANPTMTWSDFVARESRQQRDAA